MELAQGNLIKIAKISQELTKLLADADPRPGRINAPDVFHAHFRLGKIKDTSQEILETLNQCMITGGDDSTLDEELHRWISANGPVICLMALNEMKRTLIVGHTEKPFLGFITSGMGFDPASAPGSNKIYEAIKILDNHRDYFDYLLVSGIWNREIDSPHQWRVTSPACPFGGDDIRHRSQVRTSVRNVMIRGIPHNSYSSFSPSQETVVDGLGEENLDCFSKGNLSSVCYRSETMPGILIPQPNNNNVLLGDVPLRTKVVQTEENFDQVDLEKLDVILQWLDAFRCSERHRTTLLQRQADTCTWLHDTNEYKTWLSGESSFLWLHGKAGCGKSVLVASVIDQLEKTSMDEPSAFFYCDFGKERAMNATEVIRSLLYQLVDQYRRGCVKQGAFRLIDQLAEERRQGDTTLRDIAALSSLVSRVVAQFNRPPLIIIDALDECKDVDRLLCALLGLKTNRLRLFVSSRPVQVIKYKFRKLPFISMDKMVEAVSTDIELHVNREIDSDPRLGFLDPELKKRVRSTLCQKADGMFRWVQCQLDTLKGCFTLQEFLEALDNLPSGLAATYERILRGISQRPSERKVAQRVLAWLVTALRPLILTEVFEALSIDIQKQALDRSNAPIHRFALLDVLGSLVMHDEETDIINLSHFSVKEYLMDELTRRKMPLYYLNLREAHKQVFQSCMCYLVSSLDQPFDDNDTVQSRPLLDYVFSCGFNHLAHLGTPDGAVLDSMITLRSEILTHPLEWRHLTRFAALYHPYKSWVTPDHDFVLCVLISMFPEPFLHAFLRRAPCKTKYGSNPLLHTVQFDKVDHAKTLVLYGVDVNCVGWDIEDNEGLRRDLKLPLEAALRRENSVLVDLFLKKGSAMISRRVYSAIFDGQHCDYPPLFVSSLLQADDFVEWAAEVHDARLLLRPLNRNRYRQHQMTEEDLLAMIRRLVQIERNRSPLDFSEQILLIVTLAASGGHLSLLEYLFSINAPMPSGVFVTEGTAPFVRSIAIQGVNVKAVTAKGDTALHQVLGRCTGGSRCWVFDCDLCLAVRPILLAALGREIERTLTHILTTSREFIALANVNIKNVDNLELSPGLSQMEKIVLASGQLLQIIHISFVGNSTIDYSSRRWLSGKEPKACLETLQHMVEIVKVDTTEESVVNPDGGNYDDRSSLLPPEDKTNTAIALFDKQRNHFRFLLAFGLDGTDSPLRPRSGAIVNHESDDAHENGRTPAASSPTLDRNERLQGLDQPRGTVDDTFNEHQEPRREIDVLFVGLTGVGKSSLINMVMGVSDHSMAAAKVSDDAVPCTTHTTSYITSIGFGLRCQLWDTRGFDELVGAHGLTSRVVDRIRRLAVQQTRELKAALLDRTSLSVPILVWCVAATKIDNQVHWQQFRKVYVEYCERGVIPVVVITRGWKAGWDSWEKKCRDQLGQLELGVDVPLLMVRKYRSSFSPEYEEDAKALRDLISQIASRSVS